jgi:hypothetical protein
MTLDQIGVLVGAVLTLLILSYLLGDNFLYRLATHILVGVGAAYIFVIVIADVLYPRLILPLIQGPKDLLTLIVVGVGLLLGALLFFKLSPRLAWVGNVSVGYLVGVGAAVTLGGALFGTLGTQLLATADVAAGSKGFDLNLILGLLIVFGTITTLLSFGFYRVARRGIMSGINSIGRFFLSIGLGATFALVYVASVSLLIDRLQAISTAVKLLFPGAK